MGKKLYVGNLPYTATEQALADAFAECGTVESVKIITDRETGRSKGFAFVEMASDNQAQNVIEEFDGASYEGRTMKISEARPMAPREGGREGGRDAGGARDNRGPRGGGFGNRSRY